MLDTIGINVRDDAGKITVISKNRRPVVPKPIKQPQKKKQKNINTSLQQNQPKKKKKVKPVPEWMRRLYKKEA